MSEDQLTALREEYEARLPLHRAFADRLEQLIHGLLDTSTAEVYLVQTRCKDPDSYLDKVRRRFPEVAPDEISDQIGTRVVVLFEADIDEVVTTLRKALRFDSFDDKRMDRSAGYEAVHVIARIGSERTVLPEWSRYRALRFEIQIRSLLSHTWAEVSHRISYKQPQQLPPRQQRLLDQSLSALALVDQFFNDLRDVQREQDSATEELEGERR